MCVVLQESEPVARKDYPCDACRWLREGGWWGWLSFAELRIVVRAKQKGWKIRKGDKYLYQFLVEGGDKWSFRAMPEIHEICLKHDIYPEC